MLKQTTDVLFIKLCEAYHRKIVIYLYHLTGDEESAKDLTQETFTILYEKIETVINHPNQAAYIYQVSKFVANNYKRKAYKKATIEQPLTSEMVLQERDVYDTWEKMMDEKIDETRYIEKVLGDMSQKKRKLYRMRYVEGQSYKDIANVLGVSEVSVRMKIMRLKKEVRDIVKEMFVESQS